jgi:hypothetical protein
MLVGADTHVVPILGVAGPTAVAIIMALRRPLSARREADTEALAEARAGSTTVVEESWSP